MAEAKLRSDVPSAKAADGIIEPLPQRGLVPSRTRRALPVVITLSAVLMAGAATWALWTTYMGAPWTRDGAVRAYVVTLAPEVAGKIVELPVADNQFVHKGDLLLEIDPTNYQIAVRQAEAAVAQAKAVAANAQAQAKRREDLGPWSSDEEKQSFMSAAASAQAGLQQALANLDQARANLARTRIVSPVNGYVTNLQSQLGNYATVGQMAIAVINADSYWVDGYFEENNLPAIHEGDPARVKLMGTKRIIHGHVEGIARGITVANASPGHSGLATVNPIFTWVRLAQRVPVRIHIDRTDGVRLVAGMTATVEIEPKPR
jgi:RND family efflux transporter MFP subunit